MGYQYEVFWDLNRLPQINGTPYAPPSLGQYQSQGIVLQGTSIGKRRPVPIHCLSDV